MEQAHAICSLFRNLDHLCTIEYAYNIVKEAVTNGESANSGVKELIKDLTSIEQVIFNMDRMGYPMKEIHAQVGFQQYQLDTFQPV